MAGKKDACVAATGGGRLAPRFAVPDKIFGLTLFLDFIDRCTTAGSAASATGSAEPPGQIFTGFASSNLQKRNKTKSPLF